MKRKKARPELQTEMEKEVAEKSMKMLELLYDDFQKHHEHFWKFFYRASTAVLFLEILPFVYVHNAAVIRTEYFLPLCAFVIGLCAFAIMKAEYGRIRWAGEYILKIRNDLGYPQPHANRKSLESISIGYFACWVFLGIMFLTTAAALYLLVAK